MNADIKARWVAALRSGDYQQGTGRLRDGDTYCCWGVLCDLVDPEGWKLIPANPYDPDTREEWEHRGNAEMPRLSILEETDTCDLERDVFSFGAINDTLAAHNDHGATFADLAGFIEANQ